MAAIVDSCDGMRLLCNLEIPSSSIEHRLRIFICLQWLIMVLPSENARVAKDISVAAHRVPWIITFFTMALIALRLGDT